MDADWEVTFDEFDRDRGLYEPDLLHEFHWKTRWKFCKKSPGHHNFIKRQEFGGQHLPTHVQHPDFLDLFKCVADMTCYLAMSYISPSRPDKFPGYAQSGQHLLSPMVGSGMVWPYNSKVHTDDPCPCIRCRNSTIPHKVWAEVYVWTAAHNVCDDDEAKYTQVDLFYDTEDAGSVGRVFSLDGMRVDACDVDDDWCRLVCVTHDMKLYNQIWSLVDRHRDLQKKADWKYKEMKEQGKWPGGNVCVIPSHPHGSYKHLTVGVVEYGQRLEEKGFDSLVYRTCTCPGSSGAPVVFVGETDADEKMQGLIQVRDGLAVLNSAWYYFHPPHSQATATSGVNKSGGWISISS